MRQLELIAVPDFPLIAPGDDLAAISVAALRAADIALRANDILVYAQKVLSKAEGRYVTLAEVTPGPVALTLAQDVDKDPRLVELILQESTAVVRKRPGVLIVEHKLGFVHANAGIDQSNIEQQEAQALLLPEDPDASASQLQAALQTAFAVELGVIINDSAGRAWRNGTVGMAIGVAGIEPVRDLIGEQDLFGRELKVTTVGVADELAAAASFVMGQADEASPLIVIRGAGVACNISREKAATQHLLRVKREDMFR